MSSLLSAATRFNRQIATGRLRFFHAAAPAGRLAGAVASAAQHAREHIRFPVDHIGVAVATLPRSAGYIRARACAPGTPIGNRRPCENNPGLLTSVGFMPDGRAGSRVASPSAETELIFLVYLHGGFRPLAMPHSRGRDLYAQAPVVSPQIDISPLNLLRNWRFFRVAFGSPARHLTANILKLLRN